MGLGALSPLRNARGHGPVGFEPRALGVMNRFDDMQVSIDELDSIIWLIKDRATVNEAIVFIKIRQNALIERAAVYAIEAFISWSAK